MTPSIVETSAISNTARRQFISCAAFALVAAATTRAQSSGPAPDSAETAKALKEAQAKETKARAKQFVRYLKPLVAKYGPGVIEELKATTMEGPKSRFSKMEIAKRDLSAIKEYLWNGLDPEKYKVEKLEDTSETLKYRVLNCPWAEAYRGAKGPDIGYALNCAWDVGFCEAINPEIKFTRTKTLMQGDDCCNHCYELKKA